MNDSIYYRDRDYGAHLPRNKRQKQPGSEIKLQPRREHSTDVPQRPRASSPVYDNSSSNSDLPDVKLKVSGSSGGSWERPGLRKPAYDVHSSRRHKKHRANKHQRATHDFVDLERITRHFYLDQTYGTFQTLDQEGDGEIDMPGDTSREPHKPKITVIRYLDPNRNVLYHSLEVRSLSLLSLLRELGHYEIHALETNVVNARIFDEPFTDIFLRRDDLREHIQKAKINPSPQMQDITIKCAEAVLRVLEHDFSSLNSQFDLFQSNRAPENIAFEQLWMVYLPGSLVFALKNNQVPFALMIESVQYHRSRGGPHVLPGKLHSLTLHCWRLDYHKIDGRYDGRFGRVSFEAKVQAYHGERHMSSLEFVPERLASVTQIRAVLRERGREFWKLSNVAFREVQQSAQYRRSMMTCDRVIVDPSREEADSGPQIAEVSEDGDADTTASIHPGGYFRVHRKVDQRGHGSSEYTSIDPSSKPTDLMLILCPPTVRAFSLRERAWKKYNVSDLKPVSFQENAWSRLVIHQEYKDVVQAMVNSHLRQSNSVKDIVPGKGGGVVILLHGPPGVGKTLTAESVAENVNKPLYMVTAGDLGTDPSQLEQRLAKIFKDALDWDAILLLDEADVFLQDRDYENLTRNALVSIFLRTLEYFTGIMFLTSNRVGAFDQAFQSRIHITLGIPEFDEDTRKEVWDIFITDLGQPRQDGSASLLTNEECLALGREVTESWSREHLNGRQIRNCVRSALALAQDKKERVSAKHFNTVIRLGNAFSHYMTRLQKSNVDEIAQIKGDRLAEMRSLIDMD